MIRDITIGQYYPIESKIHTLDPRTKLAMTFGFIISLFFGTNLLIYLIAATALAIVIKVSKVPFKYMVKGLKSIMILIVFTVIINIFMTQGDPIFYMALFNDNTRRTCVGFFYGSTFDFADYRVINFDIDNIPY